MGIYKTYILYTNLAQFDSGWGNAFGMIWNDLDTQAIAICIEYDHTSLRITLLR